MLGGVGGSAMGRDVEEEVSQKHIHGALDLAVPRRLLRADQAKILSRNKYTSNDKQLETAERRRNVSG
jgi:hypothetical protein